MDPNGRIGRSVQRMAQAKSFARVAPHIVPRIDRLLHRATRGRMMMSQLMVPMVILTTTGAKSGLARPTPLACVPEGDVVFVVGSNYGKPHHPAWSTNLLANPDATIAFRGADRPVRAHLLDADEKATTWPRLIARWPAFDNYVERSGRDLRVFRLDPR